MSRIQKHLLFLMASTIMAKGAVAGVAAAELWDKTLVAWAFSREPDAARGQRVNTRKLQWDLRRHCFWGNRSGQVDAGQ